MTRISDAIEATLAQLDALNQVTEARKRADFAALQNIVAGLDVAWDPSLDEEPVDPRLAGYPARRPEAPRSPADPETLPFGVALPQRTTHGGPFGPSVRAKLIAEARERGGW